MFNIEFSNQHFCSHKAWRGKLFIILPFFLFSSCTEDEFIKYNLTAPETKLCMSGYICPDSTYVILSLNQSFPNEYLIYNGKPNTISGNDATVILYKDNIPFDTLISQSRVINAYTPYVENYYVSRKETIPGNYYTLKAKYKDYDEVCAKTIIPIPVQIISHDFEIFEFEPGYYEMKKIITINLYSQDSSSAFRGYLLEPAYEILNSNCLNNNSGFRLEPNIIFENYAELADRQVGESVFFSNKLFQTNVFSFQYYHIVYDNEQELEGTAIFSLYSISEDYYKYELSRHIKLNSQYDANSNPVTIYSNVEGGYGIFMGFSESKYTVEFDGSY